MKELWLKMLVCRRLAMHPIHSCLTPSAGGNHEHCIHGHAVVNDFCFACFEVSVPEIVEGFAIPIARGDQ